MEGARNGFVEQDPKKKKNVETRPGGVFTENGKKPKEESD